MIFSGQSRGLRCTVCGRKYEHTVPTSILPALLVVVIGSRQWISLFSRFQWPKATTAVLGVAAGVTFPFFLFLMIDLATRIFLSKCRNCGGNLEVSHGGFYDGCVPHPVELAIFAISLLAPLILGKWIQ